MYKILFVCTGNICRSPSAEGVLRFHVEKRGLQQQVQVDSAGTTSFHEGEAPDARSVSAAKNRGVCIKNLRARKVRAQDFYDFDLILALDNTHLRQLQRMRPDDAKAQVALFLDYAGHGEVKEVPDPYYGEAHHFEYVLDLIESAVTPLLEKLQPLTR